MKHDISDHAWDALSALLCQEDPSTFLWSRVMPAVLKAAYLRGTAVIEQDATGALIGFMQHQPVQSGWAELGSFWVSPDHRGQGIASRLFARLVALLSTDSGVQGAFLVTHNPVVVALCAKYDWQEASHATWAQTVPYRETCGPCDRVPEEAKAGCPYRGDTAECRLLFISF